MVESGRLIIFPLTNTQLKLYLRAGGRFERSMQLTETGRTISPAVKDRAEFTTLPAMKKAGPDNYVYHTFWVVVERSTKIIVSELGFKGEPNDLGQIEIGYGTMPGREGRGYMTEAVGAMLKWAALQPGVKEVIASIDDQNIASKKIVQKNNFEYYETKDALTWWKVVVKN